jgi:hypothetical protein
VNQSCVCRPGSSVSFWPLLHLLQKLLHFYDLRPSAKLMWKWEVLVFISTLGSYSILQPLENTGRSWFYDYLRPHHQKPSRLSSTCSKREWNIETCSFASCWGRHEIRVRFLGRGIFALNSRIKWLLWHVRMQFACAGTHKVRASVLVCGIFILNSRVNGLFWDVHVHFDGEGSHKV